MEVLKRKALKSTRDKQTKGVLCKKQYKMYRLALKIKGVSAERFSAYTSFVEPVMSIELFSGRSGQFRGF
jgi:hypothetical protein